MKKKIQNKILKVLSNFKFNKEKFIPGTTVIPVTGKVIDKSEVIHIVKSALDGWLTAGRFNNDFEKKLANFIEIKNLITVNSGSSANLVAFSTLTSYKLKERQILPGDEIITVATSFPTTLNPFISYGAIPVFVDIKIPTYNIDESLVENAITEKTKAIVVAHTLGNPFNIAEISRICKKYNLWLIEDCCDALGAKFDGKHVGTFSDLSTLSFYPAHHITMGEGGAVFTNNLRLKRIAESFRDWGRDCFCDPGKNNTCGKRFEWKLGDLPFGYDHKYIYTHLGYNLKITDMQAACGLAQLKKLKSFVKQRIKNFEYLKSRLKKFEEYFILPEATKNSQPSWFGFPLSIREGKFERNELISFLSSKNIDTRLLFAGNIIKQPYMINRKFRISGDLKNSDYVMNNTFWIGVFPGLKKKHLNYVCKAIEEFLNK
jgi:CDP-6-deoxy-D-xylo-4-hexulose-3-dehydrase